MPALYTQTALFWGQREGMGGGQLSRDQRDQSWEHGGWSMQGAGASACLTGTAPKAL